MKAGLRLGLMAFVAGLSLGSSALAQDTGQNTTQTTPPPPAPATRPTQDTVGPRELQNFSLGGTVTRPADTAPPATTTRPPARNTRSTPDVSAATRRATPPASAGIQRTVTASPPREAAPSAIPETAAGSSDLANSILTSPAAPTGPSPAPPSPSFTPAPEESSPSLAAGHGASMLPWILAAIALGAGIAFLFWRRRPREAFAGGPQFDAYVPPEPAPRPVPAKDRAATPPAAPPIRPTAPPAAPPKPVGVVATRLRPWMEVAMVPVACRLSDHQVEFDFDIELTNSGAAPARDILVEARLFNAGPSQEQEIGAFMAQPVGQGDRVPVIQPLQRINLRMTLNAPRAGVQTFELGGREVFVPLIAFNALYRWSGGEGQTSGSALLGRDTGAEKLAPLRADTGPRAFSGLGTRPLPTGLRK